MMSRPFKLLPALVALAALVGTGASFAQAPLPVERTTDQYTCKDIMRENGVNRDIAIVFIHAFLLGKSGGNKFNVETYEKQTDTFIEHCLTNPNDKAVDAMEKIKQQK